VVLASYGLSSEEAVHAAWGLKSVAHGFATLEVAGGLAYHSASTRAFAGFSGRSSPGFGRDLPERPKRKLGR
jgi:hypothetical protein